MLSGASSTPLALEKPENSTHTVDDRKILVDIFKVVNDHYRNDINAVWLRSQFFMLSDLGLLAFFYSAAFKRENIANVMWVSSIGLIVSIAWICIMVWTIRWIDVWRHAVVDTEKALMTLGPFNRGEAIGGAAFHQQVRPEYFSCALAAVFAVLWVLIFLRVVALS